MKKNKLSAQLSRTDIFCIAVLIISAVFFFYRIYPIIFAVHDDMRNYTLVRRGILTENAIHSAKNGRISHLWNHHLLGVPFLLNKVWFYKLVSYGTTLFDLWTVWYFTAKHIDKHFAWLTAACFMAFANISSGHNLFISYAFCHQLPLGFIVLSMHFYLVWLDKRKKGALALSCLLYLFASMIYEAFLPFVIVYALLTAVTSERQSLSFGKYVLSVIISVIPHTITGIAYTAVYAAWRHMYPSHYAGTELYLAEPVNSISAVTKYSLSLIPEMEAAQIAHNPAFKPEDFFKYLGVDDVIVSLLMAAAFIAFIVNYGEKIVFKGKSLAFIAAIFVPNILIGFSRQHLEATKHGTITYLSAFYSYPFIIIVVCGMCCLIYRLLHGKNVRIIALFCMGFVVFLSSICADFTNCYWMGHYQSLDRRYKNFDRAVQSQEVTDCDDGWQIYAPDNRGIHYAESYTIDYLLIYDDTPAASYAFKTDDIEPDKKTLCMRSDQNYMLMAVGDVDDTFCADEVTIVSVLPAEFSVVMHTKSGKELVFDNVSDSETISAPADDPFDMNVRVGIKY